MWMVTGMCASYCKNVTQLAHARLSAWHNRAMTDRELLARFDRKLDRLTSTWSRGNELTEFVASTSSTGASTSSTGSSIRELHEITMREIQLNRAAIQETRSVTRELIVELRQDRGVLADIRQGIQANTEGLLRVLDELRRGDGPGPAGTQPANERYSPSATDHVEHHLVRAGADPVQAHVTPGALDAVLLHVARAAVDLQAVVHDLAGHARGVELGDRDLAAGYSPLAKRQAVV